MTTRDDAISVFSVVPDYSRGFTFHWRLSGGFEEPGPYVFRVQRGKSVGGPWEDLSQRLVDAYAWRMPERARTSKSQSLYFRLVLETGSGTHSTDARTPYGDLDRREFLIGREIMRREMLHMTRMAGVECDLWTAVDYGPKCPRCLDPITGHTRDNHCRFCLGTGRYPAYVGPFRTWGMFSEDSRHETAEGPDGNGVVENKQFTLRTVCSVPVRKNDVARDVRTGKMYYVNAVQISAEIRRVPIVQTLHVSEAAVTDPIYLMEAGHGA